MKATRTLATAAALAMTVFAGGALAQDSASDAEFVPENYDMDRGKEVYERVGVCLQCHGWDGAGMGRNPRSVGTAPNLREFPDDAQLLHEIIACGRPYTEMPYHDRNAYSDGRCYDMTMDDFEEGEKPSRGKSIREDDIDNLVAYMLTHMIGAGDTTFAQCEEFYGEGHRNCVPLEGR
ncbi:MAG: cytochrome c [Pseudomonadota bacterium]|nr:cytochrome c [Pseudomonadota bacterium]